MRTLVNTVRRLVLAVYFAGSALLLIWAVWLLATADPDGGRHPVGAAMLVVGLLLVVLGVASVMRTSRRAS
jgi:hypothetical protein